jgi:hypothetical protein
MALALEGTAVRNNSSSVSSLTTTAFTTTQAAEIKIAVTINAGTTSSISGGGLTWALRKRQANAGGNNIELWVAQAGAALSGVQFTLTLSGSATFITSTVYAFSGQDTGTIWDSDAGIPYSGLSDPITFSTANANDAIDALYRLGVSSSTAGNIGGAAATLIDSGDFQAVEYRIVSATQSSQTATLGTGAGQANAGIVDAIMQASGGGGGDTNARLIGGDLLQPLGFGRLVC